VNLFAALPEYPDAKTIFNHVESSGLLHGILTFEKLPVQVALFSSTALDFTTENLN